MKASYGLFAIVTTLVLIYNPAARAQTAAGTYQCTVKANPERGFDSAFQVRVAPAAIGGEITLLANGQTRRLGIVSDVGSLSRADANQREAFAMILGLIHEEDVSGVAAGDLQKVSMIHFFKADLPDGDEVFVYQLFSGNKQIGGTFSPSAMGTACLQ